MISYESFKNIEESRRFKLLDDMISELLETDEYKDYSGDEIAAWSDENIIKTYNKVVAKGMLNNLMNDLESARLEIQQYINNEVVEECINDSIEQLGRASKGLEEENA